MIAAVDALADELLVALRDHPGIAEHRLMDPATDEASRTLCAAYNRLYCELHDKAKVPGCTCPAGTYDFPNAVHTDYCALSVERSPAKEPK